MPDFAVTTGKDTKWPMKHIYPIKEEDLKKAPGSVLAEAAAIAKETAIELDSWPDPDHSIFKAVIGCLTGKRPVPSPYDAGVKALLKALNYFNIPQSLWPLGVRYYDRAQQQEAADQEHAQAFMTELQGLLDDLYPVFQQASCAEYKVTHDLYLYKQTDGKLQLLERPTPRHLNTCYGQTPYSFEPKQLVIDLAAAEQLHIEFDDVKRNQQLPDHCVIAQVQ